MAEKTEALIARLRRLLQDDAEAFGEAITVFATVRVEAVTEPGTRVAKHELVLEELNETCFWPKDDAEAPAPRDGEERS